MNENQVSDNVSSSGRYGFGLAALVTLACLVGMFAIFGKFVVAGGFMDTDNFTRLAKLNQFWAQGGWSDPMQYRVNAPLGHSTHWTKPLDILLLIGAIPLAPFVGFERGLHFWAVAIAPVFYVILVFLAPWMSRPLLGGKQDWFATTFMASQWSIIMDLAVGRPDHNIILIFCLMISVGLILRILCHGADRKLALALGAIFTLGIWTTVEFLLAMGPVLGILGLGWLVRRPRQAEMGLVICGGALVGLTAALFVEKGPGRFGEMTLDQISWPFLVALLFLTLAWALLYVIECLDRPSRAVPRAICAAGALIIAVVCTWWFVPELFAGPLSMVDPLYGATRLRSIMEYLPIISPDRFSWVTNLGRVIYALLLPAVSIVAAFIFLRRGDETTRWGFGFILIAALGYFAVGAQGGVHWNFYSAIISVPVMVLLTRTILAAIEGRGEALSAMLARVFLIIGLLLGPTLVGGILMQWRDTETSGVPYRRCEYNSTVATLNDPTGIGASPKRIVAFVDFNPELLYRTKHYVYSVPNHRPQPGYTQTYELMSEPDMTAVPSRLREMKAEYLLICTHKTEGAFYKTISKARNFHDRLAEGEAFAYLQPIPLPPEAAQLRLYKIVLPGS